MLVNGVKVTVEGLPDVTGDEILRYIEYVRTRREGMLLRLRISPGDKGQVNLDYDIQGQKFERIRRITGYLVGTIDRWNNAKRAEERERVKHS